MTMYWRGWVVPSLALAALLGCGEDGSATPSRSSDDDAGASDPRATSEQDAGPDAGSPPGIPAAPDGSVAPTGALWRPKPGTSWQWDLSGKVSKLDLAADVYDIDGFEND